MYWFSFAVGFVKANLNLKVVLSFDNFKPKFVPECFKTTARGGFRGFLIQTHVYLFQMTSWANTRSFKGEHNLK